MRLTSGLYKGRKLIEPKGNSIRPTSDKVRQAIFNMLLSRIDINDIVVIDLFCGTGALSFEALSRGAAHAILCDRDRTSLQLAKDNAKQLDASDKCTFIKTDSTQGLPVRAAHERCGLVFCDPPYSKDMVAPALRKLHENGDLEDNCIIVVETERQADLIIENFTPLSEKVYGDTKITLLDYTP